MWKRSAPPSDASKPSSKQTRKNEEFQAFNNEIKHAESPAFRALEDSELELMEQAEARFRRTVAS